MSIMGIGSCSLGYANNQVNNAVIESVNLGSSSTLNCAEEVRLELKRLRASEDGQRTGNGSAVSP